MTVGTSETSITKIIEIAKDYKGGGVINKKHVQKWVNQFPSEIRDTILLEIANVLERYYISKEKAKGFLKEMLEAEGIVGDSFYDNHSKIKFLNIQRKGSSQKELLELTDEILLEEYGLTTSDCGSSPETYIYLDDCFFSGNTVKRDIERWINDANANANTKIHFVFFGLHTRNENYIRREIKKIIEEKNIDFEIWRIVNIFDIQLPNGTYDDKYECLWAPNIIYDDISTEYINSVDEQRSEKQRNFFPILRDLKYPVIETLFTTKESRQMVEKEFLEKGVFIKSQYDTQNANIKPLGYDIQKTLGFGSMFVTYRNIANNCPLVLWWGDHPCTPSNLTEWYPLFPRTVNEQRVDIEWMDWQ